MGAYRAGSNGAGSSSNGGRSSAARPVLPKLRIAPPKATSKWALQEADFEPGLVGGKSLNLSRLRGNVPPPTCACSAPLDCGSIFLKRSQWVRHAALS